MNDNSLPSKSNLTGRRVLIAEDEPLLAFEMVDELKELGVEPIGPAPSVEEALKSINGPESMDAALINVHLRGKLSFELADALIERRVPFLFVTGNDGFVREHYPSVPIHPKPADIPALVEALQMLLNQAERP